MTIQRAHPLLLAALGVFLLTVTLPAAEKSSYRLQRLGDGLYAAIALPSARGGSNALIIDDAGGSIIAGAHFTPEGTAELLAELAKRRISPLRTLILSHHHQGYNYLDRDFPPNVEIYASWQTYQAVVAEQRPLANPVNFFDGSLTLRRRGRLIILTNLDEGHGQGDVIVFLPLEQLLFTSDLVFNNRFDYLGEGDPGRWADTLELLERMNAATVVPGTGEVTDIRGVGRFRDQFRQMTTEVLAGLERRESAKEIRQRLAASSLADIPGFLPFLEVNLRQLMAELKGVIPGPATDQRSTAP